MIALLTLAMTLTTTAGVHVHIVVDDVDCGHGFGRTFIVDRYRGGKPARAWVAGPAGRSFRTGSWYRPGVMISAVSFSVWPDPMHCRSGPSPGWQIYGHLEPFEQWGMP